MSSYSLSVTQLISAETIRDRVRPSSNPVLLGESCPVSPLSYQWNRLGSAAVVCSVFAPRQPSRPDPPDPGTGAGPRESRVDLVLSASIIRRSESSGGRGGSSLQGIVHSLRELQSRLELCESELSLSNRIKSNRIS